MEARQKEIPLLITKRTDQIDSVIANAIKVIIESTPHKVDYSKDERNVYHRNWFKEVVSHKEIEVIIRINIPAE